MPASLQSGNHDAAMPPIRYSFFHFILHGAQSHAAVTRYRSVGINTAATTNRKRLTAASASETYRCIVKVIAATVTAFR
jgi:hypothetical protein